MSTLQFGFSSIRSIIGKVVLIDYLHGSLIIARIIFILIFYTYVMIWITIIILFSLCSGCLVLLSFK